MDEKQSFLGLATTPRQHGTDVRRHPKRPSLRSPKLLLASSILVFLALFRYEGEHIAWEACGEVAGRHVECSTISVPMDQFNATNSGDKVFTIPLIRMRGKNATQNLLINPGGPGGSGLEFLFRRGEQLNTIVGEGFHLLSFDPRGVNHSTPQASCYPNQETRRALSQVKHSRVIEDSPEAYAFAQNFVQACADTMGEHGLYINTPQTAADMNSILDAVGQASLIYWGFSYGTLLGQTYAGLFPERSERVIIDGVVNQFSWYDEIVTEEFYTDTFRVFEGFFEECLNAEENCTLSTLSKSKEELMDKVLGFAENIYDEPLSVYVNSTNWGTLDYSKILYTGIFPELYKPAQWSALADRLAKLLEGNATDAFLAYGGADAWDLGGEANQFVTYNDGKSGLRNWPKGRLSALEIIKPVANSSLFAPAGTSELYQKQQWTIPKTHNYVPRLGVETAHPLLILSTTFDPICPLVSAQSAKRAFAGSEIVEVKGFGHCTVAVTSSCVAKHVRAFLYNGTVPDSHTQCEVDGPYFVKPEDQNGKSITALRDFADPEEMQIHMAQLKIARDPAWPTWTRWQ
ncbi:alpha/beta-hydrolase [Cryphonectria parasitica EP155]|uniref:Alpha/beta-hydrolase n=1 Tax=Cryphonectria parasitica (strain ATCC 38755 / EP155) TaxID=660469 RepID=A0A9P5CK29_CRYP1|nr:alpha/beta-hydrolase [Cryphonectria parasitica EP155]KAF3760325.1 alpha/beta-hydrolase [Cryphonectria parasitica EP155]